MLLDTAMKSAENGRKNGGECGRGDRSEEQPEEQGMTLPEPELPGEGDGMLASEAEEL